jgi:hypothetical protein
MERSHTTNANDAQASKESCQLPATSQANHVTSILLVWLGLQLAALFVAAARVPLWAQAPQAVELLALHVMLITQVIFSSLLFPWLLRSWQSTLAAIMTAAVFTFIASLFSSVPSKNVGDLSLFVGGWLVALWFIQLPLASTGAQMTAIAVISLWAAGGPVLGFLQMEYGLPVAPPNVVEGIFFGPISGGIDILSDQAAKAFEVLGTAAAAGIGWIAVSRFCNYRSMKTASPTD